MGIYRLFIVLSVIAVSSNGQRNKNVDLDDLIKDIFNTSGTNSPGSITKPNPNPDTSTPISRIEPSPLDNKTCGVNQECVKRLLCNDGKINTDGSTIIDIRIDAEPAECGYLQVCCDVPNKREKPIYPFPNEHPTGCGYRNADGVGFKISGAKDNEAEFGEFPWMCAILREEPAANGVFNLYECGGAIIAPNVVLTAAHCVQTRTADALIVRAGEWDTQTTDEILPHQDKRVVEIIVHEKYNKGSLYNDVALLILDSPFTEQENIRAVCLPEFDANFDHKRCFATGWGKDKFGKEGKYQVFLKKIDLPIVPRDKCQDNLRKTRLGRYFQLHQSFICAGGEKEKDTCKGDGGSPLVCPIPNTKDRWYQAGIVAWGIGCNEENVPGVYANIAYLRPWIDEKLHARNINTSPFMAF